MTNIRGFFSSENFQFLEVKFSIYLNRRVFVMCGNKKKDAWVTLVPFLLCIKKKKLILYSRGA